MLEREAVGTGRGGGGGTKEIIAAPRERELNGAGAITGRERAMAREEETRGGRRGDLGRYDDADYRNGVGRDAERGTDRDDNLGRQDAADEPKEREAGHEWGAGYGGGYGRSGDYGEDGGRGTSGYGADAGERPSEDESGDGEEGRRE